MEPRLKWNKIILAAKIILFQTWFHAEIKLFQTRAAVVDSIRRTAKN